VNLILPLLLEGQIDACLAERVPLLVLFWGDPRPYVTEAHRHATKVFLQAGSVEEAIIAAEAGVDAIIVQGIEAGGHVKSRTALSTLVPAVVAAVAPVPVLAAGGIATGRGVVAALSLGAQAVSMGTRFLCSTEACVTQAYQERVVRSTAGGYGIYHTLRSRLARCATPGAAQQSVRGVGGGGPPGEWTASGGGDDRWHRPSGWYHDGGAEIRGDAPEHWLQRGHGVRRPLRRGVVQSHTRHQTRSADCPGRDARGRRGHRAHATVRRNTSQGIGRNGQAREHLLYP
jgi:nitronate monooxygenase